jgi:hypothetical protein
MPENYNGTRRPSFDRLIHLPCPKGKTRLSVKKALYQLFDRRGG